MGRAPACCEKEVGLKKGAWTAEEDQKLVAFIEKNKGHGSWRTLPQLAGLQRCGKSCRLRWTNYLRPNIKRGNFSDEEERMITQLHALLGNKWSSIASHLAGRTDNEVKNHWNTHMKKRLTRMGIDPATHRPLHILSDLNILRSHQPTYNGTLLTNHRMSALPKPAQSRVPLTHDESFVSHMAQWELARLEAEARLAATPTSSAANQSIISLIKPSNIFPASTSSASSSSSAQRFIKSRQALNGGDPMAFLEALPELHITVQAVCDDDHIENSSLSLPSFDTSASSTTAASDRHQCAGSSMTYAAGDSYDQIDDDKWPVMNSSCCCSADAETATISDHSTTALLPDQEELMMMSTTHNEVPAPPLFDDLVPPLSDQDQPCESGPTYWASLLHGLFLGPSTILSSC